MRLHPNPVKNERLIKVIATYLIFSTESWLLTFRDQLFMRRLTPFVNQICALENELSQQFIKQESPPLINMIPCQQLHGQLSLLCDNTTSQPNTLDYDDKRDSDIYSFKIISIVYLTFFAMLQGAVSDFLTFHWSHQENLSRLRFTCYQMISFALTTGVLILESQHVNNILKGFHGPSRTVNFFAPANPDVANCIDKKAAISALDQLPSRSNFLTDNIDLVMGIFVFRATFQLLTLFIAQLEKIDLEEHNRGQILSFAS